MSNESRRCGVEAVGLLVLLGSMAVLSGCGAPRSESRSESRSVELVCSIIDSEWEFGEVAGELTITDITELPSHLSYIGPVAEGSQQDLRIRFQMWSRKKFDISLYRDETVIHHVVSDDVRFTCDDGSSCAWSDLERAAEEGPTRSGFDWQRVSVMLWPNSVVTWHVFPASHGLIQDAAALRHTALIASASERDVSSSDWPVQEEGPVVCVQVGDANVGWLYWVVKKDPPYLARYQMKLKRQVRKDYRFSEPTEFGDASDRLLCPPKMVCVSGLGSFTSTLTKLERLR